MLLSFTHLLLLGIHGLAIVGKPAKSAANIRIKGIPWAKELWYRKDKCAGYSGTDKKNQSNE